MALERRQREVLNALRSFGGQATTAAIAEKTGLNVNGVTQTLGALVRYVEFVSGKGGDATWRIIRSS
ncbi:MAG: winged helix-turn-helix transcriptional regulator [bacterium]|nr:winged helix-turn-helix transcriptional regulator [bacterium]